VHDVVGSRRVRIAVLTERIQRQVAAEDVSVKLQRLPGIVAKADVRVENRGHFCSFRICE
jgi:hypothetical protein